jgi:hypothetical protein
MASGGSGLEDSCSRARCRCVERSAAGQRRRADIELHSAGALRSAAFTARPLHGARRPARPLRAASLARNAQPSWIQRGLRGSGHLRHHVHGPTPGDTAPGNDTLTRAIIVRPFNDIAVSGGLEMGDVYGGQTRTKTSR